MNIRPIHSDGDLREALAELEGLWGCQPGTPEGDKFEVLSALVEHYEDQHHPLPEADPVEFLKAAMEARGATASDLAQVLGSQPRASEILNRRRSLTLDQIRRIHAAWSLPAEALIPAYQAA